MLARFGIFWLVIELLVFYLFAEWLGVLIAILLLIVPMFIGGGIMRLQGLHVLQKARAQQARGEAMESTALESVAVVLGGVLMIIPGILSSIMGVILLIPGPRALLAGWLLRKGFGRSRNKKEEFKGRTIDGDSWRDQ